MLNFITFGSLLRTPSHTRFYCHKLTFEVYRIILAPVLLMFNFCLSQANFTWNLNLHCEWTREARKLQEY